VLGGIGNLPGAVLGGLVIGFVQAFNEGPRLARAGSDWTQSIVFAILILILVFRPKACSASGPGGRVVDVGCRRSGDSRPR
jgi:branched-subunit amino acid ABC-type transport system permease component